MAEHDLSIRDLPNHLREVIERVLAGERLSVTRAGRPVAELRGLLDTSTLVVPPRIDGLEVVAVDVPPL